MQDIMLDIRKHLHQPHRTDRKVLRRYNLSVDKQCNLQAAAADIDDRRAVFNHFVKSRPCRDALIR